MSAVEAVQKTRVMIVDDSAVVRGMVTQALARDQNIQIVASVMNGRAALESLRHIPADVVLLDVEMPEMDGMTALPLILKDNPRTKVIMVSSLTHRGADTAVQALTLGASDCIGKPDNKTEKTSRDHFFKEITQKVLALGAQRSVPAPTPVPAASLPAKPAISASPPLVTPTAGLFVPTHEIKCLAIGSSTGGPQALMALFKKINRTNFKVPVFITQHMPANFTTILATHIHTASSMPCKEGAQGEIAQPGHIYIAPGDFHMIPQFENGNIKITLNQNPPVNFCRPAVDPMFDALARIYGKNLLAVVLTGMGQDGMEGARTVVSQGGNVLAQDEATSVVWGMPGAVTKAGLARAVLPLDDIGATLARVIP